MLLSSRKIMVSLPNGKLVIRWLKACLSSSLGELQPQLTRAILTVSLLTSDH